jgi:hypothetical protein
MGHKDERMTTNAHPTQFSTDKQSVGPADSASAGMGDMSQRSATETNTAPLVQSSKNAATKTRTPGWKLFDALVYGAINFGGNIAASFWVANKIYDKDYRGIEFSGASKILIPFHKTGNVLRDRVFQPTFNIMLKPQHADALTDLFSSVLALSWGGTLLLAPVKVLEDCKPRIVRAFDKMIDGTKSLFGQETTEAQKAQREETYKLLDSENIKKTWKQAIGARAYSVFVGVFGAMGLSILADPQAKGVMRIADWWRGPVSGTIRNHLGPSKLRDTLAPITHPDMADVAAAGGTFKDYVASLEQSGLSLEDATKKAQDLFTANKPAWNISNMTVELVGSAITAGTFYVKLMFDELFRKTKVVGNLAEGHTTAPLPKAAAVEAATSVATQPEVAPAAKVEVEAPVATHAPENNIQSRFAETVGKRETRADIRQRAESASHLNTLPQNSHAAQVQTSREIAGEHGIA